MDFWKRKDKGAPADLPTFFEKNYRRLCAYAYRLVGDRQDAEDIVQELFCKLWQQQQGKLDTAQLTAYFYRATRNASLNWLRQRKRHDILQPDQVLTAGGEDALMVKELSDRIERATADLPPRCREIFEMSRYMDMSYQEIADALQISKNTVEVQMGKALMRLRAALSEYYVQA